MKLLKYKSGLAVIQSTDALYRVCAYNKLTGMISRANPCTVHGKPLEMTNENLRAVSEGIRSYREALERMDEQLDDFFTNCLDCHDEQEEEIRAILYA